MVPALFAALAVALAGCSFSSIEPDATVRVTGRALDAAGQPLAGVDVLLFKQADIGEVVFGAVLTVGSLGTVCLLPEPPTICRSAHRATTDGAGRYEFEVKGSDTQGSLGTESTLHVTFAGPAAAGSTSVSFTAEDTTVSLPEARLWSPAPKVAQRGGRIAVSWSPLPDGAGSDPAYSLRLFRRGGSVLWTQPASRGSGVVDPRLLEDVPGAVAVGADALLEGGSGAGTVRAHHLSARLPVRPTAGAPPSRGRPCGAVTGTAPPAAGGFSRCAATDGDLTAPARLEGGGEAVTGAAVDLGTARPVRLVVARGFAGQVLVEVSTDGRSYRTVATGSGPALAISPQGSPRARFVRLRSPSGLDQGLASEVSVW